MAAELYVICAKCHVVMKPTVLETVNGPNGEPACVSVFQCQRCGRLSAYGLEKMNEPHLGEGMNAK